MRGRWGVGLALCALVASGCGARWTDTQAAAVRDRYSAGGGAATSAAAAASSTSGASSSSTGGGAGASGAATATGAGASVADTDTGAGPGVDAQAVADGGPLPCAAPTTTPGVTDDEIDVATISSLSGPVPGLGASAAAATRAYVAYRNATGGVCGRQIVLHEADDGTDTARYRSLVTEFAEDDVGIAGGFSVGDVGGIDIIRDTGIPIVSVVSSDELTALPSVFDTNPPYADPHAVIGRYRYLYEQGVRTATLVYIAVDQSRAIAIIEQSLMEAAGIEIVDVQELPLSTLSYDSAARGVVNSGADYLWFVSSSDGNASMAHALDDAGASLMFEEYFSLAYGDEFLEGAGAAGEGAITWLRTLPAEEAGTNDELTTYVDWMAQVAPDQPPDDYGSNAWISAKAFFEALEAIPGPITRAAFVAQLTATGTYDADGMVGAMELGGKVTHACVVGLRVTDGAWRRFTPAQGFLC